MGIVNSGRFSDSIHDDWNGSEDVQFIDSKISNGGNGLTSIQGFI